LATGIALAPSRAYCRITVADLEVLVIATPAIEPALSLCLANAGRRRQYKRGPQPDRNSHARQLEF
jgi:hypothetical protein